MLSGTPRIACKPFRDRIADFSLRIDYDGAPAVHVEHVSRDIDSARLSHLGDEVKYDLGHQEQRERATRTDSTIGGDACTMPLGSALPGRMR